MVMVILENIGIDIDIDMDKHENIDINMKFLEYIDKAFCKISILIKNCIDKDLTYRTPILPLF